MNRYVVAGLASIAAGGAQAQTLRVEVAYEPLRDYCVVAGYPPESCGFGASFAVVKDCKKGWMPLSVSCSIDNFSSYLIANSLTEKGGLCVWNGAFIPRPVTLEAHAAVLCQPSGAQASTRRFRFRRR